MSVKSVLHRLAQAEREARRQGLRAPADSLPRADLTFATGDELDRIEAALDADDRPELERIADVLNERRAAGEEPAWTPELRPEYADAAREGTLGRTLLPVTDELDVWLHPAFAGEADPEPVEPVPPAPEAPTPGSDSVGAEEPEPAPTDEPEPADPDQLVVEPDRYAPLREFAATGYRWRSQRIRDRGATSAEMMDRKF